MHFLRHSLVCAHVRESWDAFRDPELLDLLRRARKTLLVHPDRFLIDLDDVPEDEPFNGGDWRSQLIKAGVKRVPPASLHLAATPPGTLEPIDAPPPKVPPSERPMPFGELAAPPQGGRDTPRPQPDPVGSTPARTQLRRALLVLGAGSALGLGGYALLRSQRSVNDRRRPS